MRAVSLIFAVNVNLLNLFASERLDEAEAFRSENRINCEANYVDALAEVWINDQNDQADIWKVLDQNLETRLHRYQGDQPAFSVAMQESMAYANDPNVTSWYMQKFSGCKDPIASLYQENSGDLSKALLRTSEMDCSPYSQQYFWKTFQNVASNPAGRNLLFRILIETDRGTLEQKVYKAYTQAPNQWLNFREKALSLDVKWDLNHFSINPFKGYLNFNDTTCTMQFCKEKKKDYYEIGTMQSDVNVDLFHELLHWYHALRHPLRYYDEKVGYEQSIETIVREYPFCQDIWGDHLAESDQEILCSMKTWPIVEDEGERTLDLEEIRTVLGTKIQNKTFLDPDGNVIDIALNGDELSENLFRLYENLPCRFGYEYFNYYEDRAVIDRCLDWTLKIDERENNPSWDYLAHNRAKWNPSLEQFQNCQEKGIGCFRLPRERSFFLCLVDALGCVKDAFLALCSDMKRATQRMAWNFFGIDFGLLAGKK